MWVNSVVNESQWVPDKSVHSTTHRSSHQRCSVKKGCLEISQNSQENNTCARVSFLIKILWQLYYKRDSYFSVNFMKFLRTPFYRTPLDDCFWNETLSLSFSHGTATSSNKRINKLDKLFIQTENLTPYLEPKITENRTFLQNVVKYSPALSEVAASFINSFIHFWSK